MSKGHQLTLTLTNCALAKVNMQIVRLTQVWLEPIYIRKCLPWCNMLMSREKNCVTLSIYSAQILRYLLMVPLNKIVMMGTYLAPLFWKCNFAILWYLYWPVSKFKNLILAHFSQNALIQRHIKILQSN